VTVHSERRRPLITFGIAWLLLSALSALWALATPIGAAPDEPAHLVKAASVARGQLIGETGDNGQVVQVPQNIAYTFARTCYAFEPNITADCVPVLEGEPGAIVDSSTTAGLYNPLYYAIVGWPSLINHDDSGIFAMRIISGIVCSAFLAVGFVLLASWRRPLFAILGYLAAVTPMVLFLSGTVNPNALEIAATLAAFVAVLTVVRNPDPVGWRLPAIVLVSAAVAGNMRGLSLLWLAIALLSPFGLISFDRIRQLVRTRWVLIALVGSVVAAIVALVWLLTSNSLGSSIQAEEPVTNAPGVGTPPLFGFAWTLTSTFLYGKELVGLFGWLDTPAPDAVFFVWSVLVGGGILAAIAVLRGRALFVTIGLTAAVVLLPAILAAIYITEGGVVWQGRYILPVFVCLMVFVGAALGDAIELGPTTARRLGWVVVVAWSAAQWMSFAWALKRYASGLDAGWLELLDPEWTPPGGIAALIGACTILLVATATGALLLLRRADATERLAT
jgi:hypothetical protein